MSQTDVDQWAQAGAQALQQTQAQQVRNSVQQALPVNPDQEAQTRRFATAAQVPLDTARALPDVVKQKAQMSTFDADLLARSFPKTSQLLVNPDNARLLHDDIPTTASVEQAVKSLPPQPAQDQPPSQTSTLADAIHYIFSTPGPGDTFMGDTGKVVLGGARALASTAKYGALAASTLDRPVDAALGTNYQDSALGVAHTLDEFAQGGPTKKASFKDQLLNVVGSTAGVLGEAAVTGGTSVPARAGAGVIEALAPHVAHGVQAMMVPSAVSAQDTYNSVLEQTQDPAAATKAALTAYVTSTLGGVVPFATPGKLAVRGVTGAVSGVGLGEVTHSATNLAMPDSMQSPPRDGTDRALDAVMGAMFGGMAGPKDMTQRLNEAARQSYTDAANAEASLRAGEALSQLGQLSAVSKLRERDPEAFKAFVNSVTEDGHLSEVYVDAKELTNALNQSGVTPAELQSVLPDVQAQLHEASQTNGDVRIPVADYATHIAGTDIDTAILPHLKADPDGATYAQAQEFYKSQVDNLKATADKIVAEHVDSQAAGAARDKVRDQVLAQLNAVPQLDPRGNVHRAEVMGDYYTTMAARSGMTPEQFMQTYPVRFSDTRTVNGLEQSAKDVVSTSEFRNWFGASKVVDAEGNPMVVYHGTGADIHEFHPNPLGLIFTTPEKAFAELFADSGQYKQAPDGEYGKPNMMPLYAKAEHPFDYENPEHMKAVVARVFETAPQYTMGDGQQALILDGHKTLYTRAVLAEGLKGGEWSLLEDKDIIDAVKRAGFDSMYVHEAGVKNLALFDPTQVKSAIGNDGNFDPKNPGILHQDKRGQINFADDITKEPSVISLFKNADLSTFHHEMGHFFLEVQADLAAKIEARMAAGGDVSPGEQGIAKDFETALAALGMKPKDGKTLAQTWQEMPLEGKSAGQSTAAEPMDGKRELHEKFARSYEAYLLEGKAPSVGLARAFQAFRSWMISVYRSLTGVGEKPSPELKGVFDRMLASDEAIKVAEQVRGYRPMFESAADAGMTPEEFARYQQIGKDATADATDELQARSLRDMKWLSNGKSKIIRDLQREAAGKRRELREQVTKEVDEAPAFAAKRFLDEAKKDGPTPDLQIVADKFGFDTPDEMLRAIAERGNRKDIIEGLTDQRMLQAHGDLVDPSAIERAAEAAIHNEARARFVAAELKALAKATSPARQLALAAKEAADAAIAAKKVGELRPAQYTAAEGRAARAAAKALASGDLAAAASEKRAQLLNNRLAKAATDAVEQVRKDLAYLKKFDKASIRSKLPGDFVERIDDIRGALDLRQNPPEGNRRAEALLGWAEGLRKLGYEPQIADWLNEMRPPMSYKEASVEQFRGVVDAVRSLEHIARAQKEVTVEGKKLALDQVVATLTARMDQRGQKFSKEQLIERPSAKVDGIWRAVTHWLGVRLRMVHNDLTPQEFKFNKYDLHELEGPFRKTLFDPIIEANYRKVDLLKRQSDMGRAVGDALGKDWQKSLYEGVKNDRLTDPDLSTPGNPVPMKMTRGRMLGIARHVGNESNFEKLTKGYGWNGADVWAFLHANMTAKDWQATQAHWDSFDPLWKESEAMIRRQGGVPPPKIPAREFDTPHGKMRGGYSPLDYDPLRSKLSVRMGEFDLAPGDKVGEQMLYRATTTHNSSMVSRSEGYSDRVNLDFHSTDARIRDTIHDLAYREALLDAGKVVRDARFRQKFLETYGREEYQALNDWLAGVRDMNVSDPRNRGFERAMQYSRQGVVLTGIGYRVSTVLKHGGAAALKSLGYLGNGEGAKYFAARVARMASGHLQEDLAQARDKFPEIRARMLQMDRDFKAGNRSMYETEGWQQKNDRFGHAMVAWSDALSATPTAWAAYDLARTSGVPVSMGGTGKPMTEEAAVKYASSIVRQAHGTALEATRSNFMQARGAKGFFGALYGFMNNTYGQTADLLDKSTSGGYFNNNPAVAARLMAYLIVPALWTQWLKDGGPDDQHDPWYKWTGKAIAGEVGAMVPFVRDAVALLEYGRGGTIAPMQMVTDAVNSGKDLWDEAQGKQTRLIQDLANAMGEWAHIAGLGQLGHILQYMRDVSEGKKYPQSEAQAAKEAVIGGAAKH